MSNGGTATVVKARLRSAIENSALKSLSDEFSRSFEHSTLNWVRARLLEITKASWIYRWLTAEPEPEVIVIDLRETHTVGPFFAMLNAVTPRLCSSGKIPASRRLRDLSERYSRVRQPLNWRQGFSNRRNHQKTASIASSQLRAAHSTVTLFAKLRGLSMFRPSSAAV